MNRRCKPARGAEGERSGFLLQTRRGPHKALLVIFSCFFNLEGQEDLSRCHGRTSQGTRGTLSQAAQCIRQQGPNPNSTAHFTSTVQTSAETVLIPGGQRRADLCQGGGTGQAGPREAWAGWGPTTVSLAFKVIFRAHSPQRRGHQYLGEDRADEFRGRFETCLAPL